MKHTERPQTRELNKALQFLKVASNQELKTQWRALFSARPPKQMSSPMMRRFIAYELQANLYGRLSKTNQRRLLAALQPKAKPSISFKPGTRLIREWQGSTHEVLVTERGFDWNGKEWRSLSAVAKAITGAHWSGPRFFGIHTS